MKCFEYGQSSLLTRQTHPCVQHASLFELVYIVKIWHSKMPLAATVTVLSLASLGQVNTNSNQICVTSTKEAKRGQVQPLLPLLMLPFYAEIAVMLWSVLSKQHKLCWPRLRLASLSDAIQIWLLFVLPSLRKPRKVQSLWLRQYFTNIGEYHLKQKQKQHL